MLRRSIYYCNACSKGLSIILIYYVNYGISTSHRLIETAANLNCTMQTSFQSACWWGRCEGLDDDLFFTGVYFSTTSYDAAVSGTGQVAAVWSCWAKYAKP